MMLKRTEVMLISSRAQTSCPRPEWYGCHQRNWTPNLRAPGGSSTETILETIKSNHELITQHILTYVLDTLQKKICHAAPHDRSKVQQWCVCSGRCTWAHGSPDKRNAAAASRWCHYLKSNAAALLHPAGLERDRSSTCCDCPASAWTEDTCRRERNKTWACFEVMLIVPFWLKW